MTCLWQLTNANERFHGQGVTWLCFSPALLQLFTATRGQHHKQTYFSFSSSSGSYTNIVIMLFFQPVSIRPMQRMLVFCYLGFSFCLVCCTQARLLRLHPHSPSLPEAKFVPRVWPISQSAHLVSKCKTSNGNPKNGRRHADDDRARVRCLHWLWYEPMLIWLLTSYICFWGLVLVTFGLL